MNNTELIYFICASEQIAYIEKARAFFPQLEVCATSIRLAAGLQRKKKALNFEDFQSIAELLNVEIYEVDERFFPRNVNAWLTNLASVKALNKGFCIDFFIFIKKGLTLEEKLFAIGHEIGHIVRGHDVFPNTIAHRTFKDFRNVIRNEFEANHIAGALLLDKQFFIQKLREESFDFEKVAKHFNVSYETVVHRLAVINFDDEIKFHFIKVVEPDKIVKHYVTSSKDIKWSLIRKPCYKMSACRVFDSKEKYLCQFSSLVDEDGNEKVKIFCLSRLIESKIINKNGEEQIKKSSITIGCLAKYAYKFQNYIDEYPPTEDKNNPVEIPLVHCKDGCNQPGLGACKKHPL